MSQVSRMAPLVIDVMPHASKKSKMKLHTEHTANKRGELWIHARGKRHITAFCAFLLLAFHVIITYGSCVKYESKINANEKRNRPCHFDLQATVVRSATMPTNEHTEKWGLLLTARRRDFRLPAFLRHTIRRNVQLVKLSLDVNEDICTSQTQRCRYVLSGGLQKWPGTQ